MLDKIEAFDQQLMLFLNGLHHPILDHIMHFISNPLAWIPLYILVVYVIYTRSDIRTTIVFLLFAGLTVLLADRISVMAFKEVVQRYRPCHNGEIGDMIHIVDQHCGGQFGFVSSHATNFFGLAVFFGLALRHKGYRMMGALLAWAAVVGYSRIYLGVHYPLDVLGGAILGTTIGLFTYGLFHRLLARNTSS